MIDRIPIYVRIPVPALRVIGVRYNRIRLDPVVKIRVIVSCHIVIQSDLELISLPGVAISAPPSVSCECCARAVIARGVAVICGGRAVPYFSKGGVLHRVKQAAICSRGGAGAAQVVRE